MKTLGLILTLTFLTFTGYAQETTCDLSDGSAIVTLNENSTPNEIITEFPNDQGGTIVFTEEVSAVLPTQVLIVDPNGQSVFIDALVYTTA
ncbi:MAG: hypothetical protein NXH75_17225, partial [Halobacteriovoraceae bacterium]|nr:hypothetical protein [Halobacteriovoraceae bacterium]